MLDQETKRRINSCRDILVGKLTNPFSQVEQITIALIYKFMDDMDKESVEMGGRASFFTGEYEKYSWTDIFHPRIGGHELVQLYGEAIELMNQNPNIPQLFRDIFKNAYLPYRDPETLKLFLKEINNFDYSHSEKLGDAFEYLLSFLGTQGDAGQFRTPRHIIDFIVEVVNPQKNDIILDPACGTAGFLISAYKHILKANSSKKSPLDLPDKAVQAGRGGPDTPCRDRGMLGNQLTPMEKKRLLTNFSGYDIDPLMRKLSQVNMYLHGFPDPKIYEYDTLTSEERWNDSADVILANPPFMTPKGGIRPHKRFSVQAKRSEVLFVDYIAEHLNPGGRAGVIVPEGVIFQSSNAYKNLRKMLIEDYLWAVVSLPAGVFQPYSGVKTSILLMDKTKAKNSDSILFVKIENEGTDLGAKRSSIKGSDLPKALIDLKKFHKNNDFLSDISFLVKKEEILSEKDFNLTASRYLDNQIIHSDFNIVRLGDFISEKKQRVKDGIVEVWSVSNKYGFVVSKEYFEKDVPSKNLSNYKVIAKKYFSYNPSRINVGSLAFNSTKNIGCVSPMYVVFQISDNTLNNQYLYHLLKSIQFSQFVAQNAQGGVRQQLKFTSLCDFYIPLPPMSVQEEIVAEIEGYQKIIDGARQVVDNYKPTIKIDPDWEMVKFDSVCTLEYGASLPKKSRIKGEYPVVGSNGITGWHNEYLIEAPAIVVGRKGSAGEVVYIDSNCFPIDTTYYVKTQTDEIDFTFLYIILKSMNLQSLKGGAGIPGLNRNDVYRTKQIPLPPLSVQQEIVAQIEAEQEIVNANKKLIEIYEQKIKDKIGAVWGL